VYKSYAPWEYALLGAAAFSTGVTRGISTAVIIFELACQPQLGLPIAIVVLTAHFTGNRFSKNVYEVLMGECAGCGGYGCGVGCVGGGMI
jgi:H+/Cl- antiporter ClcA